MADMASRLFLKVQLCNTADTELLQKNILQYFETSVDFQAVLITSYSTAQDILRMTLNLEKLLGKRISVTGKSKWLVFSQTGYVSRHSWLMNSQYDNVAIICDPSDLRRGLRIQTSAYDMLAITTLLYKSYGRQLSFVGTVDQAWNLQLTSDVFPNVKFGFNGRRFIVTTNMWAPYVYRREVNGTFEYYGFCIDLANELSRTLNFSIAFTEPPDGGWGAEIPNSNGSWTGMVGQVVRQEVDMVIAPIGVTGARERVVDFTFAFFYDDSAVIMKKPDPEKSKWRTYIDIFRQEVLMCIAAALILGAVVIMALEKAVTFVYIPSPRVFAKTYAGSFWYLMGAMLNQGGRDLPTSLAGRMFISSWWLFCLVVAGTYSGNLIAVLTVSKDKPPFDTLEEMANQDEYRFGTLGNSMWTTLFETSPRPEFQAIHHKIQGYAAKDPNVLHQDPDVHLSLVKQGGYAYIADKGLFQVGSNIVFKRTE
ncbi:glutamate receptor [Aplysia californica]|uniref:Glutamate receptor n=1 Tax=Aplysia californica TaxID=6500 RepID=A0ABM1A468_APLCA|nr:glutamate receptor [Aplysia californica]